MDSATQAAVAQADAVFAETINQSLGILYTSWLSMGLFLGDWSSSMAFEWRMLKNPRWIHLAYFSARIGGFIALLTYVLDDLIGSPSMPSNSCHINNKFLSVFSLISSGAGQLIFVLRCMVIWQFQKAIVAVLSVLWAVSVLSYVTQIIFIDATQSDYGLILCQLKRPHASESIPLFAAVATDTVIIGLTIWGLSQSTLRGAYRSKLHESLFRDGFV
jgi:hypothetical protein